MSVSRAWSMESELREGRRLKEKASLRSDTEDRLPRARGVACLTHQCHTHQPSSSASSAYDQAHLAHTQEC